MNKPFVTCFNTALAILFLISSGCALTPQKKAPFPLQQAQKHNLRGVTADGQKRYALADAEFLEAYRLYSSVENYEGMMTVLINFSRLYRHQSDAGKAEIAANRAAELLKAAPELSVEVWFEKTKIAMLKKKVDEALTFSEKAVKTSEGESLPRMLNLAATAHQMAGKISRAAELGGDALKASRNRRDRFEESNALHILAELATARKSPAEAKEFYLEALAIDKELALSHRVADALRGVSLSSLEAGDKNSAVEYLLRAVDVSLADSDRRSAAMDLEQAAFICKSAADGECSAEIAVKLKTYLSSKVIGDIQ